MKKVDAIERVLDFNKREGSVMKKLVSAIFSVLAFFTISGAYADQSPESIVTCVGNQYFVLSHTLSGAVNTELCTGEHTCATCIPSLEDQGCKVIDVVPKPLRFRDAEGEGTAVTYFLSCGPP